MLKEDQGRAIGYPDIAGALRIDCRNLGRTVSAELMHSGAGASR